MCARVHLMSECEHMMNEYDENMCPGFHTCVCCVCVNVYMYVCIDTTVPGPQEHSQPDFMYTCACVYINIHTYIQTCLHST